MKPSVPITIGFLTLLFLSACSGRSKDSELSDAASVGSVDQLKALLSKGANVNHVDHSGRKFSPLHWACFSKNYSTAKFLLENGADPNVKDISGNQPLFYAVGPSQQDYELIKLLLDKGADPSILSRFSKLNDIHPKIKELIQEQESPKAR